MVKKKKSLKDEVQENTENYSRIQKKLAVFLLEHWNEIPLMSIEHISKETGVSTATISRFARIFGFKGFYDFKDKLKEEVKNSINPVDRFLISMVKEETFSKLVEMIEKAPRIYSFGVSVSSIFSELIRYIFNQVQKEAHCLDEGNVTVEEKIVTLQKDDLVVFCSFYPYSRCTIDFAQLAKEQGLQVVAVSDNEFSPISEHASLVLAIPRENILFTTSISAFSVLINAIATEIAYKKRDKLTGSIKQTDKILKRFYFLG
jgi:DNA-binding MurR/RpiR family transcriptional regulator